MKASSGLRNRLLAQEGFRQAVDGSVIRVYAGNPPASANDPLPSGVTLLVEISVDGTGTGVTFEESASGGTIKKSSSEVWEGTVQNNGTAEFFRMVKPNDEGGGSNTAVRIQGSVDAAGRDMNFSNPSLTADSVQKVEYFAVHLPRE